jgi:hypothetical protein
MSQPLKLAVLIVGTLTLVLIAYASGVFELVTRQQNMERHPPELDALRAAILAETHLEPSLEADGEVGQKLRASHVVVTFDFVPTNADKKELEAQTRTIVQKYMPQATAIRVEMRERH